MAIDKVTLPNKSKKYIIMREQWSEPQSKIGEGYVNKESLSSKRRIYNSLIWLVGFLRTPFCFDPSYVEGRE